MLLLEMAAGANPQRTAIGSVGAGLSYEELHRRSMAAANLFRSGNAERVVLCDESSEAVPIAIFGAAAAGLPYVPLNYRLPDNELRSLATRAAPAIAIAGQAETERLCSVEGIEPVESCTLFEPDAKPLGSESPADPPDNSIDPDDIAVMLFTSGTTGAPKSAVLRHRHLQSYVFGSVEFDGAGEDEATLISVPTYHIAGVSAILSSVYAGRRIVQLPRFDADDWIDAVEREGITHAMVVPTMLARIVEALDRRGGDPILGLRVLSYGGGRMPLPVISRALDLFPITAFVNAYGLTETSSTVALLGPDEHRLAHYSDDPDEKRRLMSVGVPLPDIEVTIRDDTGQDLSAGRAGEIHVRGAQVAGEYLETGSTLDSDGWFPTHDSGFIDHGGYLFVQGRNDDIIIRGGENMSPGEIEDVLLTHPGIHDVAVIGIPSSDWGESILAAIVPVAETPSTVELQEFVKERMRSSRVPEHIVAVDKLPCNDTGKILRRVLRVRFSSLGDHTY